MTTTSTIQTAVRLPKETVLRLERLSKSTGRTKAFYIREALEAHLEDLEDIYEADKIMKRVRAGKEKIYTADEVRKELGLDN